MRDFIRTIAFLVFMFCVGIFAVSLLSERGADPILATMPDAGVLLIGFGFLLFILFVGAATLRDAVSTRNPGDVALLIIIAAIVIVCLIPE